MNENISEIVCYAVWVSMPNPSNQKIEKAFHSLWDDTFKYWELCSHSDAERRAHEEAGMPVEAEFFSPFMQIGNDFYLLLTGSSWSPGDICGFLKGKNTKGEKLLAAEDEVVTIRMDKKYYIPHQGLRDDTASKKLAKWKGQAEQFYLARRSRDPA